jgi:hypothetical protein
MTDLQPVNLSGRFCHYTLYRLERQVTLERFLEGHFYPLIHFELRHS